jgi:nucleotide-binding universal stress UspA family protein
MLRRILVGLNGSEFSLAAMDFAIALAVRHGASLIGLGIVDVPRLTAPEPVPLGAGAFKEERDAAVVKAAHAQIDDALKGFAERCHAASVFPVSEKQIGDPVKVLVEQVQRYDLLVVGKRHRAGDNWELCGQTLEQLLRTTPRPVISVPEVRENESPVLVAYDGSMQAARTLQAFVESGLGSNREFFVASLGAKLQEYAEHAKEYLSAHSIAAQLRIEESVPHPAKRLLEIAQEIEAGLIILGCYGQSRLKEFLFGSVTKGIVAETTIPLFLYH